MKSGRTLIRSAGKTCRASNVKAVKVMGMFIMPIIRVVPRAKLSSLSGMRVFLFAVFSLCSAVLSTAAKVDDNIFQGGNLT
jgi:hypothetical protein